MRLMIFRNRHLIIALVFLLPSCDDLIEVSRPRTQLIRAAVFEDDLTATAAVAGIYTKMTAQTGGGVTLLTSLSADASLISQSVDRLPFYENSIPPESNSLLSLWQGSYEIIYLVNSMIEGLENSESISDSLRNQLIGEAKFVRAFTYFYLINLFGDVPYVISTDYRENQLIPRMAYSQVYERIAADLLHAKALLAEDYSNSNGERVRPNKWVAAAFLSRVYLYMGDWQHAEEQATLVINETSFFALEPDLKKVFLRNSREAIWQLIPPSSQNYTNDGRWFNVPSYSSDSPVMTFGLVEAFEPDDNRREEWIGVGSAGLLTWYYPLKYKESHFNSKGSEYSMMLRLAEQFLIRAEARVNQNKLTGQNSAESDLNTIRARAGLDNTTAANREDLLAAIERERRVELFTEWGHRWLDLKRTGRATTVLSLVKHGWDNSDQLYPIPYSEIQLNPLLSQNLGY